MVSDPAWGFKFTVPPGWKFQKNEQKIILGYDTIAGLILVFPHMETGFQEVREQMIEGLEEENGFLSLAGNLQNLGHNIIAGDYRGIVDNQQAKARGIGTLSPHGGGAYITAMTVPEKFGQQLAGPAEAIARSMQYFEVDESGLRLHFAGTWITHTKEYRG